MANWVGWWLAAGEAALSVLRDAVAAQLLNPPTAGVLDRGHDKAYLPWGGTGR